VPLSAELILDVRERPRLRDYAERLERELAEQRAEAADSDEKLARASERLRRVGAKRSRLHAVLQAVRDDAYELGEECDEHNGRVGELPACPCCALALKIDSALRGEADTSPTELLDELQAPGAEARIADRLGFGGTGG
jgi:predicted nuclease with TOPRIM domain